MEDQSSDSTKYRRFQFRLFRPFFMSQPRDTKGGGGGACGGGFSSSFFSTAFAFCGGGFFFVPNSSVMPADATPKAQQSRSQRAAPRRAGARRIVRADSGAKATVYAGRAATRPQRSAMRQLGLDTGKWC